MHPIALDEDGLLDTAVAEFARATGFQLAFGGFERGGITTVTALSGHRTASLQGLRVESGRGLGGRSLAELRPRLTTDYRRSRLITHDYDDQVLPEGIVALFAYPIIADGQVRALLYGGSRSGGPPNAHFLQRAAAVGRELVQEFRISDEVARRMAALPRPAASAALLEELRSSHAELRAIAASIDDPAIRHRLHELEGRLARASEDPALAELPSSAPEVRLSPREVDVLSYAATGASNADIGRALGLTESTIKSYMKTAMSKLDATTRFAAVAAARRRSLIL